MNQDFEMNEIPEVNPEETADYISKEDMELFSLRRRREKQCFAIINRGQVWYDRLTPEHRAELEAWYCAWLDVTKTRVIPKKPEWLD